VLTFSGGSAGTHIQVLNPGGRTTACFELFFLPSSTAAYSSPEPVALSADGVTTVPINFTQDFDTAFAAATLVMRPPQNEACSAPSATVSAPRANQPQPETIQLSLTRATGADAFWIPVIAGLVLALATVLVLIGCCRNKLNDKIHAGSAWNFGDSFATNATAVGGILAAVLTGFGSSSTLLPGVQTDRFALLSAFWASLAIAAPIVVGSLTSPDPAAKSDDIAMSVPLWGLLLALVVILLAAGAQLTTLIVLLADSALSQTDHFCLTVALCALGVFTAIYVIQTTRLLVKTQDAGPHTTLQSGSRTSLLP
jgi:hypothetical protein